MYEKFYGLSEAPFSLTPNLRFVFVSHRYREAEEQLMHGIRNREAVLLVTGEPGTGKTTLCRDVMEQLGRTMTQSAFLSNPFLTGTEMLAALLGEFGINAPPRASRKELFDRLNQFLLAQLTLGRTCVAIFDEAQHLAPDFLEQLRVLSNLESDEHKLIQIVLVGQPELLDKIHTPQMAQLDQRVSVRCTLANLNEAETAAYVGHRLGLARAGAGEHVRFSARALSDVYRSSQGVPRLVNLICDRALLAGFAAQAREIRPEHIQKAVATIRSADAGTSTEVVAPRARRWPRRAAVAAALLVVAGVGGALLFRPQRAAAVPADELSYRRALTRPTPAAIERDLRGFVATFPSSRHADDALLGVAQLEQSRGDQPAAIEHFGQLAEHARAGGLRTRAVALGALASLQAGDTAGACLRIAGDTIVAKDSTVARQLAPMASTCAGRAVAVVAAAPPPVVAAPRVARAPAPADSAAPRRAKTSPASNAARTSAAANAAKKRLPPVPSVKVPPVSTDTLPTVSRDTLSRVR